MYLFKIRQDGSKYYKCTSCEKVFRNPKFLVEHIQNNHKKGDILPATPQAKPEIVKKTPPLAEIITKVTPVEKVITEVEATENNDEGKESKENKEERNKANIDSEDEGSDTSADSDDGSDEAPVEKSHNCPYCGYGQNSFKSAKALQQHQRDIFTVLTGSQVTGS